MACQSRTEIGLLIQDLKQHLCMMHAGNLIALGECIGKGDPSAVPVKTIPSSAGQKDTSASSLQMFCPEEDLVGPPTLH